MNTDERIRNLIGRMGWTHYRSRKILERNPRPLDGIMVDGMLHIVTSWEFPSGRTTTEPLVDVLARTVCIGEDCKPLGEAMIERGWTPPDGEEWWWR